MKRDFAHYEVLEPAGAGAMGVVYRARDGKLRRDVALKLPPEGALLTEELRSKWLAEARAASALNHPNICTIYEVGESEGHPYIAMEYLAGRSLNSCIPDDGLPTETVLEYGAQIASALEHAHCHGVIHRDLKLANIRQADSGQVKVLDFGLAASFKDKPLEGPTESKASDPGAAPGTLAYLAPEVLSGTPADARADIWALGILLYEMASATHPFPGRTTYELCSAILKEAPRPLPMHVPPGLRAIILRCLAKQPDQRYQRASEVKAALEALHSNGGMIALNAAGGGSGITVPGSGSWPLAGAQKPPSAHRYLLLGGLLLAVLAALIYYVFPGMRQRVGSPSAHGQLHQLLATQKNILGPALSPDGKMLAYVEQGDTADDLYVTRVAGGERVKLTSDQSRKSEPSFSPDGERIAFARKLPGLDQAEICTIATLGGEITPVAHGGSMPAWSPDGTHLTFVQRRAGESEALVITSLDGPDVRTLLAGDAIYPFLGRPSWSPDGKTIAVSRSRGGESREVWLIPLEGGPATQFTHGPAGVSSDEPVYTADGRGLVMRSNRGGAWNIWYQPLKGNSATQLTTGAGPDMAPSVARDGSLAFLNSRTRMVLLTYELATGKIKTVLSDAGILWAPVFSPDGRELAYAKGEPSGAWHIWTIPAEGGTPRQLTSGKQPEIYPRFSPDGQEIYFMTWGPEPLSIGRVGSKGGSPAHLLEGKIKTSDSYGDVSADGKWLVFARTENQKSHLYVRAVDGGEARRIGSIEGTVPRFSPDGKWIAFSPDRSFDNGVLLVHPDGTGLKRISDRGGWPVWWPDGQKIGMQTIGPEGNAEFTVVTVSSGESRVLPGLHLTGTNLPFDISPDGKFLATSNSIAEQDEIWLLQPPSSN